MKDAIDAADRLARIGHFGQVDKAGNLYIDHQRTVARILADQGCGEHYVVAGLLHEAQIDTNSRIGQEIREDSQ